LLRFDFPCVIHFRSSFLFFLLCCRSQMTFADTGKMIHTNPTSLHH
jgi:hypothetical protein